MSQLNTPDRIKKYLDGAMNAREAQEFEKDLQENADLKKAFVRFSIQSYEAPDEQSERTRKLVEDTYAQIGPVPKPELPWTFQLKMWPQPLQHKLLVFGLALILIILGYWQSRSSISVESLISTYMEPAKCKGVAGGGPVNPREIFEQASGAYCGHETEQAAFSSLFRLSTSENHFSMADYYLAHWFLKNGKYTEALSFFDSCQKHQSDIAAYQETAESRNEIAFNTILAKLGAQKDLPATLADLNALEPQVKPGSSVARKIAALKTALKK